MIGLVELVGAVDAFYRGELSLPALRAVMGRASTDDLAQLHLLAHADAEARGEALKCDHGDG